MESDKAGAEVIAAARSATYQPAIALLTAFPVADEDWQEMGADHMLVKPMHTRILLQQIDRLLDAHTRKLARQKPAEAPQTSSAAAPRKSATAKKPAAKKSLATKKPIKSAKPAPAARKPRTAKSAARVRSKA
jgi:DNA-binding response OmpR family regulator